MMFSTHRSHVRDLFACSEASILRNTFEVEHKRGEYPPIMLHPLLDRLFVCMIQLFILPLLLRPGIPFEINLRLRRLDRGIIELLCRGSKVI